MTGAAKARAFLRSASPGTSKTEVAKLFKCSRSALYHEEKQRQKNEGLRDDITPIMAKHPAYGYRRVADELGMLKQKNRVQRVMQHYRLQARIQRKKRKRPKNSDSERAPTPNLMERMCPLVPNFMWAGDFTEFQLSRRRKIYLATVLDVFTREVIGWSIGRYHTAALVIEALEDAFRKRGIAPAIFHSDQGSEYTSHECTFWLVSHGIRPSWSPKGKPWKNGRKESFYSNFKLEIGDMRKVTATPDFHDAVNRQMYYYNHERLHSKLHMPPHSFFLKHQGRARRSAPWDATSLD